MIDHEVRVHPSSAQLSRTEQLACHLAVATATLARHTPTTARDQARRHPSPGRGATVLGLSPDETVPEWAAWANGTAVRELDLHETFLAADYAHPGDTVTTEAVGQATRARTGCSPGCSTARRRVHGDAARAGRTAPRHPGHLHQGALRGVPVPGGHRPRPPAAPPRPRPRAGHRRPARDQPPHPPGDRLRGARPAEVRPDAARETLDHSVPYVLAVALEDGEWHHGRSYTRELITLDDGLL